MMYNGIRLKVLLLALVPTVAISILLGAYFINNAISHLQSEQQKRGFDFIANLSTKGEFWVAMEDNKALFNIAKNEINKETTGIAFYNKDKTQLAKIGKLSSISKYLTNNKIQPQIIFHKNSTTFITTIKLSKSSIEISPYISKSTVRKALTASAEIGWAAVEFNKSFIHKEIYKIVLHSTAMILLSLGISYLVALKISAKIVTPILSLKQAIKKITQGNLDIRVKTNANWELATLEAGVNTMASSLQTAHQELQNSIEQATADLRHTLETIEVQNIELEFSRKEAENASKIKSEFLASMSHELRTPLNGIIGFINLLLKTELNSRQYDYLLTIQKSSNTLLSIINDILDFSKMEAGKLYLDLEPMDIKDCIEDTLTLLAPNAHEKNIELIPFFYANMPNKIIGDPLRIKQIVTNLVSNSIKFTEAGSVVVRVMQEKKLIDNKIILRISVEDTGKGLTEEQQKELFHSFNQLDPKITKKFGGTGLGLVICKKLLEQMNGEINLESTPGKGSTFWFTIEVEKIPATNMQEQLPSNPLVGMRILLFEKHPITKLAITHVLKQWGIRVTQAPKAKDIAVLIKQAREANIPFHLLLIGINQLEQEKFLLNKLNSMQTTDTCPIGILVNTTDHILNNKQIMQGIALCLAKPICRAKLYESLCNLLTIHPDQSINYVIQPKKTHVLAVDDNIANLKLIAALLANINVQVTTATNGNDALKLIQQKQFSLILMDINMPDIDGIETSQVIRHTDNINKNTPIVALSAHVALNRQINMQKSTINDHLTKPINENQLKATIYKWTHQGVVMHKDPTKKEALSTASNEANYSYQDDSKELKSIDWELGKQLAANNLDLAKDLFNMLIKDLPKEQKLINAAYAANNFQDLSNYVHKLHGGCCYVGTPKLKYLAKTLERAALNNDVEKTKILLNELNKEIDFIMQVDISELA